MEGDSSVETQMKETDQELGKLRTKHREEKLAYRDHQREFVLNRARFLGVEEKSDLSNFDITTLTKNLKVKSQVTCELLNAIRNRLLESRENIDGFLKVDGGLQSILRILSGQNEKFQLIAAHCICNLALGNSKKTLQVLKASVSYLTAYLSGRNSYIKEACLIALGNFSRHGSKHIEVLKNQGFLPKIIHLLNETDANLESSAVYALTQFIYHGFDDLQPEELNSTLLAILPILKTRSFSVAFLLSILSSSVSVHPLLVNHQVHMDALKGLIVSLKEEEKEAVFYLRILTNLIADISGEVSKNLVELNSSTIQECVHCVLVSNEEHLKVECLGFLGNLVNHPNEMCHVFGIELLKENFQKVEAYVKKLKEDKINGMDDHFHLI